MAVFGYFLYCDNNIIDAVHVDARERFGRQGHRHQCIGRVFYLRHRVSYSPRFAIGDIAQFPYLCMAVLSSEISLANQQIALLSATGSRYNSHRINGLN